MRSEGERLRTHWVELVIVLAFTGAFLSCNGKPEVAGNEAPGDANQFNRIKWSTSREINNMGFNVMRGDTETGPFFKINDEPIKGAGTSDEIHHYDYIDNTIDPTRTYYYFVENITVDGREKRFTPILKAPPKQPKKIEAAAEDAKPQYR